MATTQEVGAPNTTPVLNQTNDLQKEKGVASHAPSHTCDWMEVRFQPLEPISAFPGAIYGAFARAWVDLDGDRRIEPEEEIPVGEPVFVGDRFHAPQQEGTSFLTRYILPHRTRYRLVISCDGSVAYSADLLHAVPQRRGWVMGALTLLDAKTVPMK